jgi:hypothetical protein
LHAFIVDRKICGIEITVGPTFELVPIGGIFGKLEVNLAFAIELTRVDTFLAGANVNILVLEVEAGDVVDLPSYGLILG